MQCQFKVVVGQGKYDVDTYSTSVTSRESAAEEVKQYVRDNNIKCLGFFITSLFELDQKSRKIKTVWSIKDADIDKAVKDIQSIRQRRHRCLFRRKLS